MLTLFAGLAQASGPHYQVLHRFQNSPNGSQPFAGLTLGPDGSLFGTTYRGGTMGAVFRLTRNQGGQWTETVLYDFSNLIGGEYPLGSVALDAAGNVYGAAQPTAATTARCSN